MVVSSIPATALLSNILGQVINTHVPLSPSSVTWYQCKSQRGNGRLWKWCGLPSIMLGASLLPAEDQGNGYAAPWRHIVLCLQLYWPVGTLPFLIIYPLVANWQTIKYITKLYATSFAEPKWQNSIFSLCFDVNKQGCREFLPLSAKHDEF